MSSGAEIGFELLGIPFEFILFGATLIGVALFHHYTLQVALSGLTAVLIYKLGFTNFSLVHHLGHEWPILINLLGLLLGFALLAEHFQDSKIPDLLPKWLPDDWRGGVVLLALVFVVSAFLDNIAAAMIGGSIAGVVYRKRVHIGFLAAIVAAANAGGAGSVVGDTTTTMMWIAKVPALCVLHAFVGSIFAFLIFGYFAARQQDRFQKISSHAPVGLVVEYGHLSVVVAILIGAITTNVLADFPALGVWLAILGGAFFRKTAWNKLPAALKGSIFLLALVLSASMMPVEKLPTPSVATAFFLGVVSAVFDNIPLTKLAIDQNGYDWGVLAYAVGFGGSMIWFGSSAGVALATLYPEVRSVGAWVKNGWHVAVGYILGFLAMWMILGWSPYLIPR